MAFGYEYWMVYLPDVCQTSFLLFVHNPAGATKLRDYSAGAERQLTMRVTVQEVLANTTIGRTRFSYDPHRTNGAGVTHWTQITRQLNLAWSVGGERTTAAPVSPRAPASSTRNRATRGSRRQLQDYVNERAQELSDAIMDALPPRVRELGSKLRWVSPLASKNYEEYRDGDFLRAVGLEDQTARLAEFWPAMGPCWDALGIVSDWAGRLKPGVILVEAKSHIPEIYGSGCQASAASREKIESSLRETKGWLGAGADADWLGPLYQYANRLAHLYFLLKQAGTPAWLVNLYFVDDPIGPTTEQQWIAETRSVKRTLGLAAAAPNAIDVFLPAISLEAGWSAAAVVSGPSRLTPAPSRNPEAPAFATGAQAWMDLATFSGPSLDSPEERIERVLQLWSEPIPGSWRRTAADTPSRLLEGPCYTRGDQADPRSGEHKIESEILCDGLRDVVCFDDSEWIDGVNAFPLVRDNGGGRTGNVEADLLLLSRGRDGYRAFVVEVKDASNNAWYATVENLRQLKLFLSMENACHILRQRNPQLSLPDGMPVSSIVLAPRTFYVSAGQKANSVQAAKLLIDRMAARWAVHAALCVWDARERSIRPLA